MAHPFDLSERTAVVTGASRGIGAATPPVGELDAATRSLAIELEPSGVRVNAVAPRVMDTAMWARNKTVPGVIEAVEAQTPLRRWATPDDVADAVVFLASDGARFVTGETLSADGGMAGTLDLYSGPT